MTFQTYQFLDFCLSSSCDVDKPCTESISNTDSSFDNHHCHSARKSKHNSSHLMIFLFNFMIYRILFLATKRRSMSPRGLHWESIWHERFTVTLHFWLRRLRKPVLCIFLQTHDWSIGGFGINRNRISGFPLRNDHVYAHSRTTVYPLNIPFKL